LRALVLVCVCNFHFKSPMQKSDFGIDSQKVLYIIMKRKFKKCWSTIPPISTKQAIKAHHNSLNIQKTTPYEVEIHVFTWDRHTSVAGLSRLIGSPPPSHLDNGINTYINKRLNTTCTGSHLLLISDIISTIYW
jgi:hypothetical protein